MPETTTFAFGKNWQRFLKSLNDEAVRSAEASLTEFLEVPDLHGKTFVDVGCGSGLFSYAAFRLGAERIVSFDLDSLSVECCNQLRERAGRPERWEVSQGSVLDEGFLTALGRFDVVYSWGVLHHTGHMWQAIRNSMGLVNPGGFYYIAIYNRVQGRRGSAYWLRKKMRYNASSRLVKLGMELDAMLRFYIRNLVRLQNPISRIKDYKRKRGMAWRTNIIDWLGGYPYEFASVEEVLRYVKKTCPDLDLVNLKSTPDLANNWYLFRRAMEPSVAAWPSAGT